MAALSVEEIAANLNPTRHLLCDVVNIGGTRYVADLLGVDLNGVADRRMAVLDHIFGTKRADAPIQAAATKPEIAKKAPANKALAVFSAESAIAQACQIVAAKDDENLNDINWTQEPRTEREAAIRKEFIAGIEAEHANDAWLTWSSLRQLVDYDDELVASDLGEAIDLWGARSNEESETRKRNETRRLMDRARRQVDGLDAAA
ncbi:MAG TPA: hypothetical protein VIX83_07925 [Candidatus Cybelea sp.]